MFALKRSEAKRGQATTFVVIGLLVVAAVVTMYFLRDTLIFQNLGGETQKTTLLPQHAEKMKLFTESCIAETLQGAIAQIESQGGYISIPHEYIPKGPANHFSNYLDVFGDESLPVAYWFYQTANGVETIQVPTKAQMEKELATYMDIRLPDCFNNFESLEGMGYHVETTSPKTIIKIGDRTVIATVTMKSSIEEDTVFTFNQFSSEISSSLGKLYDQARSLYLAEEDKTFLENYAYDMMVVYNEIPLSGLDFQCMPKTWQRTDIEQNLKKIFATNIPSIKLEGFNYKLTDKRDKYFIVRTQNSNNKITTNFLFAEEWPFAMDILGEDGPIIRGKPFASENALSKYITPLFCINQYHFVYNLKFPVLITLYEEGSGEIFQFATQVIIDHNQPRVNKFDIPEVDAEANICKYKSIPLKVNVVGQNPDGSMQDLEDAQVTLKCIATSCNLGTTQRKGIETALETNVPACINGLLTASKTGYLSSSVEISTNQESTVTLMLEPIYKLKADVRVSTKETTRPLENTEQVIFTFTHQGSEYETVFVSPGMDTLELAPGTYEVKTQLIVSSEQGFYIPGKKIKSCADVPKNAVLGVLGITQKKCEEVQISDIELDQVVGGTASFTWNAPHEQLAAAKKITLYTTRTGTPQTLEDLKNIEKEKSKQSKEVPHPSLG